MYLRQCATGVATISYILSIGLTGLFAGSPGNSTGADTDPDEAPDSTKIRTNLPTGVYGAGRSTLTVDDLTDLPAHLFAGLAGLRMGAVDGSVRGGRPDGVSIYLENIRLDNAFRGYTAQDVPGNYSIGLSTELPELGLEEVGLVFGATPLMYGNAPDGVVNLVARQGHDRHQGRVRITTEGRFLANWNTVLKRDWLIGPDADLPPDLLADTNGDGVGDSLMAFGGLLVFGDRLVDAAGLDSIHSRSKLDSFGYDYAQSEPIWTETRGDYDLRQVSYSFSGPLPGPLHYAISGEFLDPGSVPFLERERTNYNVLGKLTIQPSERLHMSLTWLKSKQQYKLYSYGTANTGYNKYQGGYLPGYGPLYPSQAMLPFLFFDNQLVTGTLTYTPNANSRLNLTLGRSRSGFEQKIRDYDDRDGDGDYEEYLVFREIQTPITRFRLRWNQYVDTVLWQWRLNTEDEELAYIWTQDPAKVNDSTYSG